MKKWICLITIFLLSCIIIENDAFSLDLYGYTFDDDAFADKAYFIDGTIEFGGFIPTGDISNDLNTALAGSNMSTWIRSQYDPIKDIRTGYTVELHFVDNYIYNGVGSDLIGWEFGTSEPFSISIYNPQLGSWTDFWNIYTNDIGDMNVGEIDFDHWGLSSEIEISKIRVSSQYWSNSWIDGEIAAFGGLNSNPVPEPTTMVLLGAGLIGLAGLGRKKFFGKG